MSSMNYSRLWYVIGVGLVVIVVVASLVPAADLPKLGLTDKLEHMIAYGGLALWFGGLLAPRRYWYLGLALLALGGGIEIAQGLMGLGREADWRDFYADGLGAALGLSLSMAGLRHWSSWIERCLKRT